MGKIIGIDLGTTNSCVAVIEGSEPVVITNEEGNRTTPSVVHLSKEGERKIGSVAKRQATVSPENTISSVKRFMGKTWAECKKDVESSVYKVVKNKNGTGVNININDKDYAPQEISAMVLSKLKKAAEDYLGTEVTEAVITVPAYFNDSQRNATKEAGAIAGLEVKRIVNEPTAAALAYGFDKANEDKKVAVFDLGGGTFDISILEISDGMFDVLSTNGDTELGGDDFDGVIEEWIFNKIQEEHNWDARKDNKAVQRVKEAAENAKIELSSSKSATITLPYLMKDIHVDYELTRSTFESLSESLISRCMNPVAKALEDAELTTSDIDEIIMVGGSTRIPKIQEAVKTFFDKDLNRSVNPDEVVALGAAIQAGVLGGEVSDLLLLDVTPLSLAIETRGGEASVIIPANTTIPTSRQEQYTTTSDNQDNVEVHILQGERPLARENKSLGKFHLEGIPPKPRGVPRIEVTMDIDANGILNVSAKELSSGKQQTIRIEGSSSLSQSEIERMKQDAETYKEDDEKRAKQIELINQTEAFMYTAQKFLNENKEKINREDFTEAEDIIVKLRTAIGSKDETSIIENKDNLENVIHKITENMSIASENENVEEEVIEEVVVEESDSPPDDEIVDEIEVEEN